MEKARKKSAKKNQIKEAPKYSSRRRLTLVCRDDILRDKAISGRKAKKHSLELNFLQRKYDLRNHEFNTNPTLSDDCKRSCLKKAESRISKICETRKEKSKSYHEAMEQFRSKLISFIKSV